MGDSLSEIIYFGVGLYQVLYSLSFLTIVVVWLRNQKSLVIYRQRLMKPTLGRMLRRLNWIQNTLHSKVVFGDFDNNYYGDAVFFSSHKKGSQIILRLVDSEQFIERLNITSLPEAPNVDTKLLFGGH